MNIKLIFVCWASECALVQSLSTFKNLEHCNLQWQRVEFILEVVPSGEDTPHEGQIN